MPDQHLDLVIVVSGVPRSVRINLHVRLEQAVRDVLRDSGNSGQPPEDFELRTESGQPLSLDTRAGDAGLHDGQTLFLNPRAGAGG